MNSRRLGVGFIGSGFVARFHISSWIGVRDADVRGVWSPNRQHAEEAAAHARNLRVGDAKAFGSIEEMIASPDIDCIWLCNPNHTRLECMEQITHAIRSNRGSLVGVCCEKPLARNVAEAKRMVELVEQAGLLHGYLENQVFTPGVTRGKSIVWARGASLTGRPYLARAAEEH
ncbi:MAG TPA: Gfo/Idh/MocA family oxidoreductase, partial [Blastocatellia bacterium]